MTTILSLHTLISGHGISHAVKTQSSILIAQLKPALKFKAASIQYLTDEVKTLERLLNKEEV